MGQTTETTQEQRTKKDELLRTANTVLLSVITVVITIAATMIIDSNKRLNDKIDSLMIQVAVNSANLAGHELEAGVWKSQIKNNSKKIDALEAGNVEATMDRITKTEALRAIDDQRKWVEKYFARK